MAKLVFGMNQSLDGCVDHLEMRTGPALFRHWIEHVRDLTGSVYGRRMYEAMRYWDEDRPEWSAEQHEFAALRPEVVERRMRQVIETNKDVFLNVFDIYAETEMAPWLSEIRHPALVLTGENDGGCNPRLNRRIAEALPNSELVILPVLRHAILIEAADQVAPPVLRFLRKQK